MTSVADCVSSRRLCNECLDECFLFFFSSRRRHTRFDCDWSSDVCSSDLSLLLRASYVAERAPIWPQKAVICQFVVCLVPRQRDSEMVTRAHKWIIETELAVMDAGSIGSRR